MPTAVRLQVWGDGSKNKLTLRLNDATGERFTRLVGAVDWNGWRAIEASDPAKWSHYLGNNDGIVDLPIANVGIELASGGAASGALYVDDVRLLYPQAGERLVEGFEVSAPSVGLRFVGEAGTTVVAGLGLGPDLQKPLPMVLVRRSASETTFQALIEPAAEAPQVTSFQALPTSAAAADEAGAFAIASPQFSDRLLVVADGAPGVLRRFGGEACDGTLCFLRRDAGGQLARVALGQGQRLESGMTPLVTAMARVGDLEVEYLGAKLRLTSRSGAAGELKIYAPAAMQVELNGGPAPFQRMNEYVLIGAVPAPDLAMAPPADLAVAPVADLAVAPPVDLGAPAADLAVAAGDAAAVAVDLQAPSLDGASPLVEGGAGDGPAAAADLAAAGAAGDLATASADGPTLPSDARGCACSVGAQPKAGAQGWLLAALLAVAALRRIGRRGAARGR